MVLPVDVVIDVDPPDWRITPGVETGRCGEQCGIARPAGEQPAAAAEVCDLAGGVAEDASEFGDKGEPGGVVEVDRVAGLGAAHITSR